MSRSTASVPSTSPAPALGRAAAAALVMGVTLALMSYLSDMTGVSASPDNPFTTRLAVAAPVAVVVVVIIVLLRRRWDRAPLTGIGLTGTAADLKGFLLGIGVVTAAGTAVIGVLLLVGSAELVSFQASDFALFLATNAAIALLLEAVPEEVSLRGYALSALRSHYRTSTATILSVVSFLCTAAIAIALSSTLLMWTSGDTGSFQIAPGGEDPFVYYLTLTVFGLMLVYARGATRSATVWTCIGAHLAWLTVNRIVLGNAASGIDLTMSEAATMAFFAIYMTAAIIGFSLLRDRADRCRETAS